MQVETFYPNNSILKNCIEYYYFLRTDSPDFESNYYSFPHINHSLNIHKNASCKIEDKKVSTYGNDKYTSLAIVQGKYTAPLFINLKGKFDKITIIFKPLGFNHFIHKPFYEVAPQHSQLFEEWNSDEHYHSFLKTFFATFDYNQRVDLLEAYLLSIYHPIDDEEMLLKAIHQLTDFDKEHSVESIAGSLSISARSLDRLFVKHLGITPIAFKKIARFRHSLKNKIFSAKFKTLTEIGYESNFYDQSYFIRIYKKLTGDNPSAFFNTIDKLADNRLLFKFVNK